MAKTKEIYVSVSRKISDGEYGSFGAECGILVEVGDDDDRTEVAVAGMSFASARVASTHKAHGTIPSPTEPVAVVANTQPHPTPVPAGGVVVDGDVPEDWCAIHNCQMTKRPKGWTPGDDYWFSHKDGEAWCRGK